MARLPVPGGDNGDWGDILNAFLDVSHNPDGTLANNTVGTNQLQSGSVTKAQLDGSTQSAIVLANSAVQTVNGKTGSAVTLAASDVSALSTTTKLSDLADTSAASSATDSQVLSYNSTTEQWVPATVSSTSVSDATTSSKGIIELSGDLGGTAASPSVEKISGIALPGSAPTSSGQVLTATGTSATTWQTPAAGIVLDTTASDIQTDTTTGSPVAGSTGKAADAGHQHPLAQHDHSSTSKGGQLTPTAALSTTGTASISTYLRGDNSWVTPPTATNATSSAPGLIQLDGDLGGSATSPTVAQINGVAVSGTPSTGEVLAATGANAASWGALTASQLPSSVETASPTGPQAWAPSTAYVYNEKVFFWGATYSCNTPHTSSANGFSDDIANWTPVQSQLGDQANTGLLGTSRGDVRVPLRSITTLDDTSANDYSFPPRIAGLEPTRRYIIVRNWSAGSIQVAYGSNTDSLSAPSSGWITIPAGQEAYTGHSSWTMWVRPLSSGATIRYEVERCLEVAA
jgi:Repeat of unknown function (DUF5907)